MPTSTPFTIPASNSTNINVEVAPHDQLTYSLTSFNAPNGTIVTFFFTSFVRERLRILELIGGRPSRFRFLFAKRWERIRL